MDWIVYVREPNDVPWNNVQDVDEVIKEFDDYIDSGEQVDFWEYSKQSFLDRFDDAQQAAREQGWQGDFRGSPCVFWLPILEPYEESFLPAFLWQQDDDGIIFVVSPFPLPWL